MSYLKKKTNPNLVVVVEDCCLPEHRTTEKNHCIVVPCLKYKGTYTIGEAGERSLREPFQSPLFSFSGYCSEVPSERDVATNTYPLLLPVYTTYTAMFCTSVRYADVKSSTLKIQAFFTSCHFCENLTTKKTLSYFGP